MNSGAEVTDQALKIYYDGRIKRGSAQHFWHFLFGYFLPLMSCLMCDDRGIHRSHTLLVQDFGPVMNPILDDVLSLLDWDFRFVDDAKLVADQLPEELSRVELPNLLDEPLRIGNSMVLPRWDHALHVRKRLFAMQQVYAQRFSAVKHALDTLLAPHACCDATPVQDSYLLLERSEQPSFYGAQGLAENKGYGRARRVLRGLDEAYRKLTSAGIPVHVYEPGLHNLGCQIAHFSRCAGIIGVRGAEFANMFWMRKNSLVLLLQGPEFPFPPAQPALAKVLELTYRQINTADMSPVLQAGQVLPIIQSHQKGY